MLALPYASAAFANEGEVEGYHTKSSVPYRPLRQALNRRKFIDRNYTAREGARLQSFPDNFFFEGSRSAAFKQIGNAVPPLLSEALAKKIIEQLNNM